MATLSALPVTTKKLSDVTSQAALGNRLTVTKTTSGVFVLLPAVNYDRLVAFFAYSTESFADNTGTKTLVKLGQSDDDDKFESPFPGAGEGNLNASICPQATSPGQQYMGILSADQALIATVTAAVGDGTGGMLMSAVVV